MRKVIGITSLLLFIGCITQAQLLSVSPQFPVDTGKLTITADFSRGNQGLFNYGNTNDVYVHIGVITSASANPGDWKHVRFAWGTTNDTARATSLGNNRYSYTIDTIRSFFKVSAGETILKIAILFRSGNGNLVQRNSDGSDMYIPVYGNALAGKFIEPFFQPKYIPVPEPITKTVGEKLLLNYLSNGADTMQLFFDGVLINQNVLSTALSDSPVIATAGLHTVVGVARKSGVIATDTFRFFIAPPVTIAPLPAGVRDGINYQQGDTSVILVLHAPEKNRVSVLGDFNNWTESVSYQMNKTPDNERFWLRITGLTPGAEYAYQYQVDDNLRIADPFTQKVLDPNNDQHISATTYPNLKAYPTGKTTGNASVLQTAEPAYTWQVNNFARPDKRRLVIYELLLRDFVAAHDWKTLKDTLSYLKNLGVNAIELMPFNEFEGNLSWGYNTSFYFAPDKYYGPKNRLKEFVDECHKNGIAVIMDIALNHAFGQSPMVQLYWDAANNRPAANSPWYNPAAKHAFNVGYDMNHESLATRAFTGRVVEHWLQEYKLDGFRFDLSKGFTQNATCDANGNSCNVDAMGNYDASRVAIWKRYYDTVQLKAPGAYVILEHFAANNEEVELSNYGMLLWGNLNHSFNQATMGKTDQWNFSGAIHTARNWTNPHLVAYMESHDEDRLMRRNLDGGLSSGSYNIRDLATGLKRNEAAAAFFLMIPGPKMIWQFGEMGYDYSINYCISDGAIRNECRTGEKPIKWDYMQDAGRKRLHDIYAGLLKLRNHALYRDAFASNRIDHNLTGAVKWLKITTDTSNILVIANFDVVQATGTVSFQGPGTWYDYINGATFNPTGSAQSITLQPGEYHVYLNRNLTSILTPVFDFDPVEKSNLHIYPNPVSKNAIIEYELPVNAPITISLLDMYGRRVQQLYAGFRVKGVYKLPVTAGHLTKGVYFVQLEYGKRRQIRKMIVE